MVELSTERIQQMLHEETAKKEDLDTILRCIYTRYMCLFEKYLEDIDALNDDKIAEFRKYNEETKSLNKYYYMDIPMDINVGLEKFEDEYTSELLGPEWHQNLTKAYEEFKKENKDKKKSEEEYKADFKEEALDEFYNTMDFVFRDGFGTSSETAKDAVSTISGFLFGKE